MKLHQLSFSICAALIPIVLLSAQDRATPGVIFSELNPSVAERAQRAFNRHEAYWIDGFGTYYGGLVRISAVKASGSGAVLSLKGSVVMNTDTMTLTADEVVLNTDSHTIEATGSVRVVPVVAR